MMPLFPLVALCTFQFQCLFLIQSSDTMATITKADDEVKAARWRRLFSFRMKISGSETEMERYDGRS